MQRTKLIDRTLPDYTVGEEIFNMVSHIVGALLGVAALVICILTAHSHSNTWGVVSGSIYGATLILLYTMSSVYHGIRPNMGKKVLQVIDHCTIYFLIAGTYTPILLSAVRKVSPGWAWTIFGIVWGLSITACVFTAIDLKKYSKLSMICYLGIGWCIVIAIKPTLASLGIEGFMYILVGGISYSVGSILYGLGKKKRYMHSIFHLFVLLGSILHFIGIIKYVL